MSDTGTRRSLSQQQLMMMAAQAAGASGSDGSSSYPPSVLHPEPPVPTGPTITSLVPDTSIVGQPVTVKVYGTNFVPGTMVGEVPVGRSDVLVDGVAVPTSGTLGDTELTVASRTPTAAGTAQITVRNPDGAVSNALPFTVTAAAADEPLADTATVEDAPVVAQEDTHNDSGGGGVTGKRPRKASP